MFLQYIIVEFTPSIILLYLSSPELILILIVCVFKKGKKVPSISKGGVGGRKKERD
jgi:hypothetical protein